MKQIKKTGFTLIELLVIISIVSFLATLSVSAFSSVRVKARDAKRKYDLKQIISALDLYNDDFSEYPDTNNNWQSSLLNQPWIPGLGIPYFHNNLVPVDPLNEGAGPQANVYYYISEDGGGYCLRTNLESEFQALNYIINQSSCRSMPVAPF